MKNWVLAVVLHGSILAVFVLFLFWNAGKFDKHAADIAPRPAVSHSSGMLPVVPVIRAYNPVLDTLREDLASGRAICDGGYFARQALDGSAVRIRVDGDLVPCS